MNYMYSAIENIHVIMGLYKYFILLLSIINKQHRKSFLVAIDKGFTIWDSRPPGGRCLAIFWGSPGATIYEKTRSKSGL